MMLTLLQCRYAKVTRHISSSRAIEVIWLCDYGITRKIAGKHRSKWRVFSLVVSIENLKRYLFKLRLQKHRYFFDYLKYINNI